MSVRKITNKGTKKVIGKFPSLKMNRTVRWESQLERDYIYLLEFDPDVLSYKEQPRTTSYHLDHKEHHYTPDFFVVRPGKQQIVEVKPEHQAAKEEYQALFRAVAAIYHQEGHEFIVATDTMIQVQPRLDNIKQLTKYARATINPQHQIACHEFLTERDEVTLDDIIQHFAARAFEPQVIYALLYRGILAVDLMQSISLESSVYMPR